MFEVTADHQQRLLRIVMNGFWDTETMTAYSKEVRQKLEELRHTAGCKYILINMIAYPIQSKPVADGHAANLRAVKERGEARVALVMQSALSKLQAARVASDTGHATFNTETEALAWLLSKEDPPA